MLNCTYPQCRPRGSVNARVRWYVGLLHVVFGCRDVDRLNVSHTGVGATAQMRDIEASRRDALTEQGAGHEARRSSILALTGMSSLDDKKRAFDAGVDG